MKSSPHIPEETTLEIPFLHLGAQAAGRGRPLPRTVWLYRLIRTALAIVFIWSGCSKLIDPRGFAAIIQAYGLIPDGTVLFAAIGLSSLELAVGAGLALDLQWSLGIITGLLLLFMAILGYGLWLGLDVDCGCFGPDDPEGRAYHSLRPAFYRDMVMMTGIGYLFFWRWRQTVYPVKFSTLYQFYSHIRRRK